MANSIEKRIRSPFFKGVDTVMILHYRDGHTVPHAAEVFPDNGDGDYHTEYGLFFEGKSLEDSDAAGYWTFGLPAPLAKWLKELGLKVDSIHIAS